MRYFSTTTITTITTTYLLLILSSTTQATKTPGPVADYDSHIATVGGDIFEGGDTENSKSDVTFSDQTFLEKRVRFPKQKILPSYWSTWSTRPTN